MLWLLFLLSFNLEANELILRSDVSFNLPQAPHEELVKVMWWNVSCSSTRHLNQLSAQQRQNFSPSSSWENLNLILNSQFEPDVLILGEYCPSDFDSHTYENLAANYPYIHEVMRSNPDFGKRNGLRVFSKHPLEVQKKILLTNGAFSSNFLSDICQHTPVQDSLWARHLSILKVKSPKGDFTLAPIHLANPWREIAKCKGLLYTAREIYNGTRNVNYLQSLELINEISGDTPYLIIGDFNAPRQSGLFFNSNSYNRLTSSYGESLIFKNHPTFIDKRGKFPNASIDHAFGEGLNYEYGEVLPLSGSDHLPIIVGF